MDAISNNDSSRISQAYNKSGTKQDVASTATNSTSSSVQLTDLSGIASRASNAGDDIRQEAIDRAKLLLSDPNWLNDKAVEGLAEKLLSTEDFAG